MTNPSGVIYPGREEVVAMHSRNPADYGITDEMLMEEALREEPGPLSWWWDETDAEDFDPHAVDAMERGSTTVTMRQGPRVR